MAYHPNPCDGKKKNGGDEGDSEGSNAPEQLFDVRWEVAKIVAVVGRTRKNKVSVSIDTLGA